MPIRPAEPCDAHDLALMDREFSAAVGSDPLGHAGVCAKAFAGAMVLVEERVFCGGARAYLLAEVGRRTARVSAVYVGTAHRRAGVGRSLLDAAAAACGKELVADVPEGALDAQLWLSRCGFVGEPGEAGLIRFRRPPEGGDGVQR